jgi:hypothetical protein
VIIRRRPSFWDNNRVLRSKFYLYAVDLARLNSCVAFSFGRPRSTSPKNRDFFKVAHLCRTSPILKVEVLNANQFDVYMTWWKKMEVKSSGRISHRLWSLEFCQPPFVHGKIWPGLLRFGIVGPCALVNKLPIRDFILSSLFEISFYSINHLALWTLHSGFLFHPRTNVSSEVRNISRAMFRCSFLHCESGVLSNFLPYFKLQ